jgi:hypothetical protein
MKMEGSPSTVNTIRGISLAIGNPKPYVSHATPKLCKDARFMEYDLGYIDLEEKTLQPLDNPFGPKV